jgi:hypothetical protein
MIGLAEEPVRRPTLERQVTRLVDDQSRSE